MDSGNEHEPGSADPGAAAPADNPKPLSHRIAGSIGRFTDRYPFVGPTAWMLAMFFFVAQVAVAYDWQSKNVKTGRIATDHPYNFFTNTISDLGETAKFTYGNPLIWSPYHVWMNISFILLGAVMIVGSPLIYQEFSEGDRYKILIARIAFALQFLAGVGAVLVGTNPENVDYRVHILGAFFAIFVGTLGVFLLGFSLPLPGRLRRFMLWCMPVSLVAGLLFALSAYLGFGKGGMERIAAYPEVIWLISFGFYIARSHLSHDSAHRALLSVKYTTAGRTYNETADLIPPRLRFPARGRLPDGRVGSPYDITIAPIGGTGRQRTFTEDPNVAPGLHLSTEGRITGTPTRRGRNRLHIEVRDSDGIPIRKTFTLIVAGQN